MEFKQLSETSKADMQEIWDHISAILKIIGKIENDYFIDKIQSKIQESLFWIQHAITQEPEDLKKDISKKENEH